MTAQAISRLIYTLIACLWTSLAFPATSVAGKKNATAAEQRIIPDSQKLEKSLQELNWKQFRTVIEAVPKLKADVEAYGPAGWNFVKANYTTYKWRRQIKKLDDEQKLHLDALIKAANKTSVQPR